MSRDPLSRTALLFAIGSGFSFGRALLAGAREQLLAVLLLLLLALPLLLALIVGARALLVVEGEMEREAGALALLALDLHPSAMAIDDFLHDRKPDT